MNSQVNATGIELSLENFWEKRHGWKIVLPTEIFNRAVELYKQYDNAIQLVVCAECVSDDIITPDFRAELYAKVDQAREAVKEAVMEFGFTP